MRTSQYKQEVRQLVQSGQVQVAERLCRQVLSEDPESVFCLSFLANQAFSRGALDESEQWLRRVLLLRSEAIAPWWNLGLIWQRRGEPGKAAACFLMAVKNAPQPEANIEPALDLALALVSVDRLLAVRWMSWLYSNNPSVAQLPHMKGAPPNLQRLAAKAGMTLARDRFDRQWRCAESHLRGDPNQGRRVMQFLRYFHGLESIEWAHPLQRPSYHFFPGLRAQPFYALDAPWERVLKSKWREIAREKDRLLTQEHVLKPYVSEQTPDDPDWKKLEHNLTWTSAHLIKGGVIDDAVAAACPVTMEAVQALPLARMRDHAPEAFFSILRPGTYIPPHYGLSNLKLTVHLGLDIPSDCAIKVGQDLGGWRPGEVLIFDDSFHHSAWNHSRKDRAVLITEVWHPDLHETEQAALQAIMQEQSDWNRLRQEDEPSGLLAAMEVCLAENIVAIEAIGNSNAALKS